MELRIRNLNDTIHQAASVAARRQKVSLNELVLDAIKRHVFRVAQKDKAVAAILDEKVAK